jgi:hypothetical protein
MPVQPVELAAIDFEILKRLPDEGMKLGYADLADTVRQLCAKIDGANGAEVNGRLRSLRHLGLARSVKVTPVGKGLGWQRTEAGKRLVEGG